MKNKERTFFEMLRKFFKSAFIEKKVSIKAIIPAVGGSIIGMISVFLLKDITNGISNGLDSKMINLLGIFIGFIIIHYLLLSTTSKKMWYFFEKKSKKVSTAYRQIKKNIYNEV